MKELTDRVGTEYLCPRGLDKLELKGRFGSPEFSYFEIEVKACDLPVEECMPGMDLSTEIFEVV